MNEIVYGPLKIIYLPLAYFFLTIAVIGALFIFRANYTSPWQHFTDQAQSFLQGRLDIITYSWDMHDYTLKNGRYYWPEGPFPSLLILPFLALFGPAIFNQGTMQIILIAILILTLYKLTALKKFNLEDRIFLVTAYILGSTAIWPILDSKSWFFAQVVAMTFLSIFIYELETKRRLLLLGFLGAALFATRPTAGFILPFLTALLLLKHIPLKEKILKTLKILLFPSLSIVFLLIFNYLRFQNIFDNGYLTNDIGGFQEPLRKIGLFSLSHIPTNIYYYFIESFQPVTKDSARLIFPFIKFDIWGLSFFLVAPIFIFAFKTIGKYWLYWFTIGVTLYTTLSYYSPGWYQYGPRYTADFLPILFILLLNSLNGTLNKFQKLLISLSSFLNVYLLFTRQFNLIPT